ncbi:hypothetical protein [Myceligenerans pegani]|uniref:Uncharacterized protein n=1 Tax=Myceligenerans pegani TaxID=2776917 RepID=A0ABR9N464_9MICO|nr:hypothetical protein [Myceligenerans sp. TRM 65318]MBE1877899.1 hypothetical protein [Myceligenerans sp. TRM 65318]MBE3020170.1 hypothetical protein [Myceligenerans sp. TRM 65318]
MHPRRRAALIIASALVVPLAVVGVAWGVHLSRQAEAEENTAIEREEARAAVVQLIDAGEAARAELGERIDQGRDTAAAGRTADAGVLQALNEALSTAESHHAAPAPEAPSADATVEDIVATRTKVEEWAGELRWMSDELARNIHETERSQAKHRSRHVEDDG